MRAPALKRRRLPALAAAGLAAGLLVSGCSSSSSNGSANATEVTVTLTSDGCAPSPASVDAGLIKFNVKNENANGVTEAELLSGSTVLGEKENLTPGLSGSFSLRLKPGSYVILCPGAKTEKAAFTVTGTASAAAPDPSTAALATKASDAYHQYVVAEAGLLLDAAGVFANAVKSGDIAAAKAAFGPARVHYESIEPVAESFGDLDPAIDARIDDVADTSQWTGFHRLEKALWEDNSLEGMAPIADKLMADIKRLQSLVADQTYQPAQIANGSVELLDEIARTKVTGEEDRYSHTDLYDFAANIAGARTAFTAVEPLLRATDPDLAKKVELQFSSVLDSLQQYKDGDGWVDYSTVDENARRGLAQQVDALAEPLSLVASRVG